MTTNRKLRRRLLVATSLVITLAALGCSSNQYAGNGQPTMVMPTYNSVNHATTPGSSSGTEGVPPMASSFTYVRPRLDVDALANFAAAQGYRGRILGASGAQGYLPGVTVAGGEFVSPALYTNPQATVNTSISSQPVPVITGGQVGVGINVAATGTGTPAVTNVGTTAASTTGTTAATAALTTATGGSTTIAGSAVFAPALMNSTPAPQATGSTGPALKTVTATGRATTSGSTVRIAAVRTSTATMAMNNSAVSGGIRIQTASNGGVTVTNVSNNASTTGHH